MALRRVDDAVFLVSSAAHPVGGDELVVRVDVGPGAHVMVRSVAAMLVWPGPGGESSTLRYEVSVADGGSIDLAPEPTVAVSGCRHRNQVMVDLTGDARLRWREEIVLGRAGEEPGHLAATIRVTRDGRAVLATGTRVGGDMVAWSGPAVTAGHRRLVTEVRVGDEEPAVGEDPSAVVAAHGIIARHEPAPGVVVVTGLC